MTEQEFRLQADRALEGVQRSSLPLADEEGFSRVAEWRAASDLRGTVCREIRRQS